MLLANSILLGAILFFASMAPSLALFVLDDPFAEERYPDSATYPDSINGQEQSKLQSAELTSAPTGMADFKHLDSCDKLAKFYLRSGAAYRGRAWAERTLQLARDYSGDSGSRMTRWLMACAIASYACGDLASADKYSARAIKLSEKDPYFTNVPLYVQRAGILRTVGKYSEAEKVDRHALTLEDHKTRQFTNLCYEDLAQTLIRAKRWNEATEIWAADKGGVEDSFRSEGRKTFMLAHLHFLQGQYDMSGKFFKDVLAICPTNSPGPSETTYRILAGPQHEYGQDLAASKQYAKAVEQLSDSAKSYAYGYGFTCHYVLLPLSTLNGVKKLFPSANRGFQISIKDDNLYEKARLELLAGETDRSLADATKELELSEKHWGKDHPYTADVLILLGMIDQLSGSKKEALSNYARALAIVEKNYGKNDLDNVGILELMADAQLPNNADGASTNLQRALSICKSCYPRPPVRLASIFELLGDAQSAAGDKAAAASSYSQAKGLFLNLYGVKPWSDLTRIQDKLESLFVVNKPRPSQRKDLVSSPGTIDGHVYHYICPRDKTPNFCETQNWGYVGELKNANLNSIKDALLFPPPDVQLETGKASGLPPAITNLNLSGARSFVVQSWFKQPELLAHLVKLNLSGAEINDQVFAALQHLTALTELNVADTNLTAAELNSIAKMTQLQKLDLSGNRIDGNALLAISQLPHLSCLAVDYTNVSGKALSGFSQLTTLRAAYSSLSDPDVVAMQNLKRLSNLDISGTNIGDPSIPAISSIPSLRKIVLHEANFSKEGGRKLWDTCSQHGLNEMQGP
jgi:tetratricopeptide (TPR) repeat protein